VQLRSDFFPTILRARAIAIISACRDSSISRTEWLMPSAIMVSPRATKLPNGYSPSATPFLASCAQRAIIA
jgi:hypothetical protein